MGDEQPIGAEHVARKQFATAFRGFDQYEVRAFLAQVAAELASLQERERSLRERLSAAEEKPAPKELVSDDLEAALGVEMGRVLHAAREAAAEIRARAEESVARMLKEANDEATHLRGDAESVLARRTEEAEEAATGILSAAEQAAQAMRSEAEATATAAVEEAQQRGREMVAEAQAVRERILKDLARRRKVAATQLEQLRAGRERLLSAYEVVRTTLEEATGELSVAEAEARLAAEAAGFRPPPDEEGGLPVAEPATAEDEAEPVPEAEPAAAPAADVQPEPEPEPEAAPPEPPDHERRSSSLRLLRRRTEVADLPPLEDDMEGVRIIRPEPATGDPTPSQRPVAVPAPEAEPEPAAATKGEHVAPEHEAGEAAVVEETVADDEGGKPVEDLFARLRADRAAAVAQAEAVLAEATPTAEQRNGSAPASTDEVKAAEVIEPAVDVAADADGEADGEAEPVGDEAVFEARDTVLDPTDRLLVKALKRALSDEQNEVLDTLRRLRGTPRLDLLLPSTAEHVARFAGMADEYLRAGAAAGAASVDGEPPKVDDLVSAFAEELTDDLRARLERALDASSTDEEALVEAISATYREWKTARGEPLARHYTAAAYALGVFSGTNVAELQWVVDAAEGACPDCDDNALAGPTAKGSVYPTGQQHPPAHAGCRCLVLPVGS